MTRMYASSPSSVLSLSHISFNQIAGYRPRILSPSGGLPLGLAVEAFNVFRLIFLAICSLFLTQVDFQIGRVTVILSCRTSESLGRYAQV